MEMSFNRIAKKRNPKPWRPLSPNHPQSQHMSQEHPPPHAGRLHDLQLVSALTSVTAHSFASLSNLDSFRAKLFVLVLKSLYQKRPCGGKVEKHQAVGSIHEQRQPDGQHALSTGVPVMSRRVPLLSPRKRSLQLGVPFDCLANKSPADARIMLWWCPPVAPLIQQERGEGLKQHVMIPGQPTVMTRKWVP